MTKHTPGPWILRGEADPEYGYDETQHAFGVEPAGDGKNGGWPYMIRQDRAFEAGQTPLHLACGIQNLEDARLIAAAPDMLAALEAGLSALRAAFANVDGCDIPDYADEAEAAMSAAIAKAKGE